MSKGKKGLAWLLCLCLSFAAVLPAAAAAAEPTPAEKAHVSFGEDGKLKILQVADIQDIAVLSSLTAAFLRETLKQTRPDLILLTGDNISGNLVKNAVLMRAGIMQFMNIFEEYGAPVAVVFGNDDDRGTEMSKQDQIAFYQTFSCFIGIEGEPMSVNCGNYNIPIYESADSDKVVYNIWMLDSGNYYRKETGEKYGYGVVYQDQLDWYVEKSNELKAANGGRPVPSMVFQHIIPVQIYDALEQVPAGTPGAVEKDGVYWALPADAAEGSILGEAPCPPNRDVPQAYAEVETMLAQGDVKAIVAGHDHINSYVVPYRGINLICSPACTFRAYSNSETKGLRTFTLRLDDLDSYETEVVGFEQVLSDRPITMMKYDIFNTFNDLINSLTELFESIEKIFHRLAKAGA